MLLHPALVARVNYTYSFLCGVWLCESVVQGWKGTAGLITVKLRKQVLFFFFHVNLSKAGVLEPEL